MDNHMRGSSYRVFISHAGPEKLGFATSLWRTLGRNGLEAFLDWRNLYHGDNAAAKMEQALRRADAVIIVLTQDFLRSAYCMEELRWALDAQQERNGSQSELKILTELYHSHNPKVGLDVDELPGEGGMCSELVRQALAEQQNQRVPLEQQFCDLAALTKLTCIMTHSVAGPDDDSHISALVTRLIQLVGWPRLRTAEHPVAVDEQVENLLPLLQPDQPGIVRILSLFGKRGVGKTTLALALFNELAACDFRRRVFFQAGRGKAEGDPLFGLQRELLEELAELRADAPKAHNWAQQRHQLELCFQSGPILLVLDDLWSVTQRDQLLFHKYLPPGSRVVLTGRSGSHLLPETDDARCCQKKVLPLGHEDAQRLLCMHAFGHAAAPEAFTDVVSSALATCAGLPLALETLGRALQNPDNRSAFEGVMQDLAAMQEKRSTDEDPMLDDLRESFYKLPRDRREPRPVGLAQASTLPQPDLSSAKQQRTCEISNASAVSMGFDGTSATGATCDTNAATKGGQMVPQATDGSKGIESTPTILEVEVGPAEPAAKKKSKKGGFSTYLWRPWLVKGQGCWPLPEILAERIPSRFRTRQWKFILRLTWLVLLTVVVLGAAIGIVKAGHHRHLPPPPPPPQMQMLPPFPPPTPVRGMITPSPAPRP